MTDQVEQSVDDTNGRNRQAVQSYQSIWMAHWMQASCNAEKDTHDHIASETKELDYATKGDHLTNGLKFLRHVIGFRSIETRTSEIVDESVKMGSKGIGNERVHSSLLKFGQDTDNMQALRHVYGHDLECGKAFDCKSGSNADEISLQSCHFLGEGTSKNPPKLMKAHPAGKDSRFAMSKEAFGESSCHIVPHRFDLEKGKFNKGKAAISEELPNVKLRVLEHEHGHKNKSADLVRDRKMERHLRSENSENVCFGKSNTSHYYLSTFGQSIASGKTETKKSHNDCNLPPKSQNCGHDAETVQICTTVDSQMPHSLSKEHDLFRSLRVITEIYGTTSSDHHLSPVLGQGKTLSSSIDSEAKHNAGQVEASKITIKDELSAETDTMDMDSFKEKNVDSGECSYASTKNLNMSPLLGLADINLEVPTLSRAASSSENTCSSPSKTQSLEVDKLLTDVEQPKANPNLSQDDYPNAAPGNGWAKFFKLSSLNSYAQGTKSSKLDEISSPEKMSKYFDRILKSSISSSELDPQSKDEKRLLLSNAWIQRWLRNRSNTNEKKPEAMVVCEPESSNLALDDLQNKQFPSIAAMALMGKAMTGFPPCELEKRGSSTVWNTKAF